MPDIAEEQGRTIVRQQAAARSQIENIARNLATMEALEKVASQHSVAARFARGALVDLKAAIRLDGIHKHELERGVKLRPGELDKVGEHLKRAASELERAKQTLLISVDKNSPMLQFIDETERFIRTIPNSRKSIQDAYNIPKRLEGLVNHVELWAVERTDEGFECTRKARDLLADAIRDAAALDMPSAQQLETFLHTKAAIIDEQAKAINRLRFEMIVDSPKIKVPELAKIMSEASSSGDAEVARLSKQLMEELTQTKKLDVKTAVDWMRANGSTDEELTRAAGKIMSKGEIHGRVAAAIGAGVLTVGGIGYGVYQYVNMKNEMAADKQKIEELRAKLQQLEKAALPAPTGN